jgi:predicted ATPase/DNA-binding winged helix-turn-helix (wHTH) protein
MPKGKETAPKRGEAIVFAGFHLVPATRTLTKEGHPVPLGARAFDILIALIERAGQVVSKPALLSIVWPKTFIEESALRVHVAALRKALGDGESGTRLVVSIRGRGYMFAGEVEQESGDGALADHLNSAVSDERQRVPVPLIRLIGRDDVVVEVAKHLSRQRLVTITGTGGIGKTTVARAVAERLAGTFRDGAQIVDLGSLTSPQFVASHLGSLFHLSVPNAQSLQTLLAQLRTQNMLIVFDNCEHVIEAVSEVAEAILRAAPEVRILATSRQPLGAMGERVQRLMPLALPPSLSNLASVEILRFPAIQLFAERCIAQAFHITDADAPIVAEICTRLDGLPLAIELAVSRVSLFGLRGLANRLDDRFSILTKGRRTAIPRHQTLGAMIDWSYQTLNEDEKIVWRRLAIFRGAFTIEAADAIAKDRLTHDFNIIDILDGLLDKSLISVDMQGSETSDGWAPTCRWRLLETIRAYAHGKLVEAGEVKQAARSHAKFFQDQVAPLVSSSQLQPTTQEVLRCGREIDNVRAALDWCFSKDGEPAIGAGLTVAYVPVWSYLGLMAECRDCAERALECLESESNPSAPLLMHLYLALGLSSFFTMGFVSNVRPVLIKALEIAERIDDVYGQVRANWTLWALHFNIGQRGIARFFAKKFARAAHRSGDPAAMLLINRMMGIEFHHEGKQRQAQQCFEHLCDHHAHSQDPQPTVWFQYDQQVLAQAMLARVLWLRGFPDQAVSRARASLQDARAKNHTLSLCYALHYAVCPLALLTGDTGGAERATAMLIELAAKIDTRIWGVLGRCWEGRLLIKRAEFSIGLDAIRASFDMFDRSEWTVSYAEMLGVLAEGLAGVGEITGALATIDQALATADRDSERWCISELLRIKGEVLLRELRDRAMFEAEACFHEALQLAHQQEALSWELRAALSLARLKIKQGNCADARMVLAPIYDQFTEGFTTEDLSNARALVTLPLT